MEEGITVIAHRGGAELFSENTLTAFRKSVELGVDAIECDVQLSKDGQLVIVHDSNLNRVAGIDKNVSDLTMDEISRIELPGGEKIPSLESALKSIDAPLVIELKSLETASALSGLFEKNPDYVNKCIVISFFHDAILMMRSRYPSLMTGALIAGFPVDPASVAKSCSTGMLSFNYNGLTEEYVERCHQGGVLVSVWAPGTEKEISDCLKAGVDAIGSDRPDLVLKAIGRNP